MSLYMIISMIKPFGRRDYVTKCIFIPIKAKRIVPGLRFCFDFYLYISIIDQPKIKTYNFYSCS